MGGVAGAADRRVTANGHGVRWLGLGQVPPHLNRPAVWVVRSDDPLREAIVADLRPSREDLTDAALFRSPERSSARLARRLLLKAVAGAALGVPADRVVVERSRAGAIRLAAPEPLYASLSARDGWTMLGLSREPIGVDIERSKIEPPLPWTALADAEAKALAALTPGEQSLAFSRLWTVKEASLKAIGFGLTRDPAGVTVRFCGDMARVDFETGGGAGAELRRYGDMAAAVALVDAARDGAQSAVFAPAPRTI